MKDLGMMHYFLGLEVWKYPDEIFLNQEKYSVEILKIFGKLDCKAMTTLMNSSPTYFGVRVTSISRSSHWLTIMRNPY